MKRLTLTYEGRKIISDPFNFKAFRIIYEFFRKADNRGDRVVYDLGGFKGIVAMFDGTPITGDVVDQFLATQKGLNAVEVMAACDKVMQWYTSTRYPKEIKNQTIGEAGDPVLHLYFDAYKNFGILPSELDKQDPQLFYNMVAESDSGVTNINDIPPEMRIYYGY